MAGVDTVLHRIYGGDWLKTLQDVDSTESAHCMEALTKAADLFLRAGGQLTMDDWIELSASERSAFASVGHALQIERSILTGRASRDDGSVYDLAAQVDGGQLFDEDLFDASVKLCAEKYNHIVVPS